MFHWFLGGPVLPSPSSKTFGIEALARDIGRIAASTCPGLDHVEYNVTWCPTAQFLKVLGIALALQALVAKFAGIKCWQTYSRHLDYIFMLACQSRGLWYLFCEHLFWPQQIPALIINCTSNFLTVRAVHLFTVTEMDGEINNNLHGNAPTQSQRITQALVWLQEDDSGSIRWCDS